MASPLDADSSDPAAAALALVLALPVGSRARIAAGEPWGNLMRERLTSWGVETEREPGSNHATGPDGLAAIRVSLGPPTHPGSAAPDATVQWSRVYRISRRRASLARFGVSTGACRVRQGWVLVPGARRPNYLVPLANPRVPSAVEREVLGQQFLPLNRSGWRQRLRGILARAIIWPGLRRCAPVVLLEDEPRPARGTPGYKLREPDRSFTEELVSQALSETAVPILWMVRLSHSVVVPCWVPGRQTVVFAKLALSPLAAAAQTRQAAFIRWLTEQGRTVVSVPRVLAAGAYRGQDYLIETGLPGTGGGRVRLPLDRLLEPATAALVELAQSSLGSADAARARSLWRNRLATLDDHPWLAGDADWPNLVGEATRTLEQLDRAVVAHNDFHLGNVVYDRSGKLTGVLDWDLADADGLPATDLIHLLVSVALRRRRTNKAAVLSGLAAGRFPAEAAAWSSYSRAVDFEPDLARWLPLYVATQVWRLTEQARFAPPDSQGEREMASQARLLLAWQASRRET